MIKWCALFLLVSFKAIALEAVITVLETPILKSPSYDAPVVQYLRRGDVIKIHPSLNNNTDYDHLSPTPKKLKQLTDELKNSEEWKQDPLFSGEEKGAKNNDEFIPTWDRQGNVAYVIRDHLYIYYSNRKELTQSTPGSRAALKKDPTDYRLDEPLPKNYPLITPTPYRGQMTLGVTQPYYESYAYPTGVKTKGYMSPIDFNLFYYRHVRDDKQDRFYFGGTFNARFFTNSFALTNGRFSEEKGLKFGVGPAISYDVYKGLKNRLNLYGNVNVYFFNQLLVTQSDQSITDRRTYRTISLAPRIGAQYHRKGVVEDVDFVIGTSLEVEPATTFRSKNAADQETWWRHGGSDKFKARTSFSLAGYIGFQSAY